MHITMTILKQYMVQHYWPVFQPIFWHFCSWWNWLVNFHCHTWCLKNKSNNLFWSWIGWIDICDSEISFTTEQAYWHVTISPIMICDLKNKKTQTPITQAASYKLLIMRIIFSLFLITGLVQFYRQLNIQRVQMVLRRSQGLCWRALSHHPPSFSVQASVQWRTIQHHYQGFFHLNQVEIDNRFSPSHRIRERHC